MILSQNDIYAVEGFAGSDLQKYEIFFELLNSHRIVFFGMGQEARGELAARSLRMAGMLAFAQLMRALTWVRSERALAEAMYK